MRWGVEKRLEFIEFRLFWEGGINRADITEHFGVSVPQASKDLTLYEEKAPGNLLYDKSAKRYRAASDFNPVFLKPHAGMYLAQLRTRNGADLGPEDTWLAYVPDFDAMPIPYRRIEVDVLRSVLAAVRAERAIEIKYQSMNANRPAPEWRWIAPHAFGYDGLRWHVRAFCHIDRKFKDFILSRCMGVRGEGDAEAGGQADKYWHQVFGVRLAPNLALSKSQQAIIAQDYEMVGGEVEVPVRKALLYYFQKRLRLDVDPSLDKPHEVPVVIANREPFIEALAEAMS